MRAWIVVCAAALEGVVGRSVKASPPAGHLVFFQDQRVCVESLTNRTRPAPLPLSQGAIQFSLSPYADATIVFFAPRKDKGNTDAPLQAFYSRPPYHVSRPLPLFLNKEDDVSVSWTRSGEADIGLGDLTTRRLDPRTGALTVVKAPGSDKRQYGDGTASRAYTDDEGRVVLSLPAAPDRTLFDPTDPTALFAAVKRARSPANLKDLLDQIDPALWKERKNWAVGQAVPTPDGKIVFFTANLGTGKGAQGNTTFCWFAARRPGGGLSVLSKAGLFFGRVPVDDGVSPEGKTLFFATSVHNSAADNSFSAYTIDLATQQTRELLHADPAHTSDANLMNGWCWSPDGRYIAISAWYYDPRHAESLDSSTPDPDRSTLYIKETATGRTVFTIQKASLPKWSAY